jgi:hypothetical protein
MLSFSGHISALKPGLPIRHSHRDDQNLRACVKHRCIVRLLTMHSTSTALSVSGHPSTKPAVADSVVPLVFVTSTMFSFSEYCTKQDSLCAVAHAVNVFGILALWSYVFCLFCFSNIFSTYPLSLPMRNGTGLYS